MEPERRTHYVVDAHGESGLRVLEDGDLLAGSLTSRAARDLVHQRLHRRAFELASRKGWVRLHGAVVDVDGARIVVTGPSGAGKTSLCVRLLLDGGDVQCDESFLVREGVVLASPRPLHLKDGATTANPDIAPAAGRAPCLDGVTLVDPRRHLERDWSLTFAPPDVVAVLDPAATLGSVMPMTTAEAMPDVLAGLFPVTETKQGLLGAATALVSGTARLRLGPADTAAMSAAVLAARG